MENQLKIFTIPNFITCLNIFCGCVATVIALKYPDKLEYCALFVGLAAIFDFLDGFFARLLKSYSAIGKELDSLADMVSFGVVPGCVLFQLLNLTIFQSNIYIPFCGFLITLFSGLRLAKFNVDTRQSLSFIGLPTPANAIFIVSLPLLLLSFPENQMVKSIILNHWFLIIINVVFSYLLVSEIPMFSLKFSNYKFKGNQLRYIFLGISLFLIIILKLAAFSVIILIFITLSIVSNFISHKIPKNKAAI